MSITAAVTFSLCIRKSWLYLPPRTNCNKKVAVKTFCCIAANQIVVALVEGFRLNTSKTYYGYDIQPMEDLIFSLSVSSILSVPLI